jgi:exonuclease III
MERQWLVPTYTRDKTILTDLSHRFSTGSRNTLHCEKLHKNTKHTIYHTTHPDETAHGGTAIIIRQNIKHHVREGYKHDNLQATSISLEDNIGETTVSAIYCPPRHNKYEDYD